jgi:hypothetical protein
MMRYADMTVVADSQCPGVLDEGQMCTTPLVPGSGPCEVTKTKQQRAIKI